MVDEGRDRGKEGEGGNDKDRGKERMRESEGVRWKQRDKDIGKEGEGEGGREKGRSCRSLEILDSPHVGSAESISAATVPLPGQSSHRSARGDNPCAALWDGSWT